MSRTGRVRFSDECTIHHIDTTYEPDEYAKARSGDEWMYYAADRCRFKARIRYIQGELNEILNSQHRLKVFKARFSQHCEEF